ncbi:MAG: serine--tRNA ligase [Alphaproteobacteria bacterium]|nr:serine--tRNA ligase [Alphaproteobacteria bacterium]PPR13341.1 MAG: Serine--tRNA ligase [Alphaproteobacteria bacterium MarineAlpha12_Bin1]|tara:strand:+ start:675 stop:1961 length:1287 start_codon:yes stop_codon:yes gene_type:complete
MFDLKWIRENPSLLDDSLSKRGIARASAKIIEIDLERRALQTELQESQGRRNEASKKIGEAISNGLDNEAEALKDEIGLLKNKIQDMEQLERDLSAKLQSLLEVLPNVLSSDIPEGNSEHSNVELRTWGALPEFSYKPLQHFEIGENLSMMDFDSASKISGSRFVILKGLLARLERALAQFMLDIHVNDGGYTEVSPPLLVRDGALYGTGQLPKFSEDLFRTDEDYWLIPTAEVPLTNIFSNNILSDSELPIRVTAHTSCFRSEAGASGRDTRGMLRQHQFYKVELVSIVHPEKSADELERMTNCAESVMQRLELPYRVMLLCSGDTGFASTKTYDIEVWLPGENKYREISSCSNTGEFQARRMKTRFRIDGDKKGLEHVHTLNGSGVAIGRALIAILENYQCEDGTVIIPSALRPYMNGLEVIDGNV